MKHGLADSKSTLLYVESYVIYTDIRWTFLSRFYLFDVLNIFFISSPMCFYTYGNCVTES